MKIYDLKDLDPTKFNLEVADLQVLLSQMNDTQRNLTAKVLSDLFDSGDEESIDTDSTSSVESQSAETKSADRDGVDIDFHRQLRNELIMIPIPKSFSIEFNEQSPLNQGHYLELAFKRVSK